jgi:hypothetical protein
VNVFRPSPNLAAPRGAPVAAALVAALAACAAAFGACSDDSKYGTLDVELAATGACGAGREAPLPAEVTCLGVELCRPGDAGVCEPVPLVRSSGGHGGPGARVLRLERQAQLTFDTAATGGGYVLRVTAYDASGAVVATGTATDVAIGGTARVRLQRPGQWTCAPGTPAGALAARALHHAVSLPSGEVLVFGGVAGDGVDLLGLDRASSPQGARLEPSVEVFVPSEQRFAPVAVRGTWRGRVLSSVALLPDEPPGPYRIALYGGYETTSGAVLRLDARQTGTTTGTPLVPDPAATPGSPLLLTYDPASRALTVEALDFNSGSFVSTGFGAVSDLVGAAGAGVVVLGAGAFREGAAVDSPLETTLVPRAFWYGPDGRALSSVGSATLSAARFGATATRIDSDTVLLWGGSVGEATAARARELAGEVVRRSGASVVTIPIAGGVPRDCPFSAALPADPTTTLPDPTAFHTATAVAGRRVLLAGGLLVGGVDCPTRGVSTLFTNRPLVLVAVPTDPAAPATAQDVPHGDYEPSILHAALPVEGYRGAPGGVLLTGGAVSLGALRLGATAQAGIVTVSPSGPAYTPLPPLRRARWGHTLSALPGGRVLVVGGFEVFMDGSRARARALDDGEVLLVEPDPAPIAECADVPFVPPADAGRADAGPRDAGPVDAGPVDAGPDDAAIDEDLGP